MSTKNSTIKDIAMKTGFSIATVSRVVNKTGNRYTKETEEIVKKAIEELSYIPDIAARELKRQRKHTIGYLVPTVDDYYAGILSGIQKEANELGYSVVMLNSDFNVIQEELIIRNLREQKFAGLIVGTEIMKEESIIKISEDFPIVSVGKIAEHIRLPYVALNDYEISKNAVNYLISMGHSRIAFICGSLKVLTEKERFNGYIDALQENNIKIDPAIIFESSAVARNFLNPCYDLIARIYKLDNSITALFILSDYSAFTALKALSDMCVKIPQEVSIIGFDNLPMTEFSIPPLTTISQDKVLVGSTAMKMLFDYMNNDNVSNTIIDAHLVVRGSTGSVRS